MTDETSAVFRPPGIPYLHIPYAEGDLRVATFRDPSGTVIGVWQRARGNS